MGAITDIARARAQGAEAARRGATRGTCPYPPDADAPARERTLFAVWQNGYNSVRPLVVDYSGEED